MKPTIEQRMETQMSKVRAYNTLFDLVVTTSEESLFITSTNPADNQYTITGESFTTNIICNDNDWNTVSVYIDVPALDTAARVAEIQINIQGGIEENYHSIPRSVRTQVMNLIDDIFEAVEGWINERIEENE